MTRTRPATPARFAAARKPALTASAARAYAGDCSGSTSAMVSLAAGIPGAGRSGRVSTRGTAGGTRLGAGRTGAGTIAGGEAAGAGLTVAAPSRGPDNGGETVHDAAPRASARSAAARVRARTDHKTMEKIAATTRSEPLAVLERTLYVVATP